MSDRSPYDKPRLSYEKAGVSIDTADAAKRDMADILRTEDCRVLNRVGAFAALFEAQFPGYTEPVLVFKAEEPGSKQLLSVQHGRIGWICYDLINHLVNDIIVMGARPVVVLDTIICGKMERDIVVEMVKNMEQACRELGCVLIGGETSEQPGVLQAGRYVLTATVVGIVEKSLIIDGSAITSGDVVLALPANGLHTNGYTLIRRLLDDNPDVTAMDVQGESFIDAVLKPHRSYYHCVSGILNTPAGSGVHGMAHITGGGIRDNLRRILPSQCRAVVDLSRIDVLPVFSLIQKTGDVALEDMLRTFNMGVGLAMVVAAEAAQDIQQQLSALGCDSYQIGYVARGDQGVEFCGQLQL